MENIGFKELHKAIQAARIGREILLNYYGRLKNIEEKFQAGLVSEADKESEKAIVGFLQKEFPETTVLAEEGFHNYDLTSDQGRWIIDPLDGTTNYIHQFPIFCISIGLEIKSEIVLAVIDVPMLNETYTAIKGKGAFLNGKPLKTSETKLIKDSLLATGFIADHEHILQEQLRIFSEVVRKCRAVRRAGAAAYDLCLVAKGAFDGYWERNLKPWDSAAGLLLVQEAGGKVSTYRGEKYTPFKNSIVASNSFLHAELLQMSGKLCDNITD